MNEKLTDRKHWEQYWKNYEYEKIPKKVVYGKFLQRLQGKNKFIEIGGFPGINAAYFYKNGFHNVTILDFYTDNKIVNKLEAHNDIPEATIECIEADFFDFQSEKLYDIVFSVGFIEHFDDTKDVIERHVWLLSANGSVLIILPNFRGLNGLVQYLFDRKNFKVHNLNSMKINNLQQICRDLKLQNITVDYSRKPMLWLEPKPGLGNKLGKLLVKIASHSLKLFPVKCRLLSPYIIIYAEK